MAIDHHSSDHVALKLGEFPDTCAVELVETRFPTVPAAVLRGEVDAGVWHITQSVIPLELAGLVTRPPSQPAALEACERLSGAVLVGWEGRPELGSMLPALPLGDLLSQADALLNEGHGPASE